MFEQLNRLFSSNGFMPHGHCYLWKSSMIWLQVISNGLIFLSYFVISVALFYLVLRMRNLPFQWMYLAFGIFIVSCGVTHLLDVWTIWSPIYWVDVTVRGITAVASLGTAILLPALVPKVIELGKTFQMAIERGMSFETAYQDLNRVFEKTKELDALKTQIFANISHELRTPLALILSPTEKISMASNLTEEQRRDLNVVIRNARVLLKNVNDLLDVAKLEAGKVTPNYTETDLVELVRLTASNFDGIARERDISYLVETPSPLIAQIDPDMVQRIIFNLLSNAFKFTPSQGKIIVSLRQQGVNAVIAVQDNGPGIEPKMREAIFERFRQLDSEVTRQFGGTGLGLSIAKEFTELHLGRIHVSDSPEGGSLFTIEIPLAAPLNTIIRPRATLLASQEAARNAIEELKNVTRTAASKLDTTQFARNGTVLIVEDNFDMNRYISETLSREYEVITAFNGKEGLEKTAITSIDLILSDIMMPVMSGDRMVAEIRKKAELDNIPIILLTARADDSLRVNLLREGAQDYIIKPFSSEELLARVKNLITIKRTREILRQELASQLKDLEALSREVISHRKELQASAENLRIAKDNAEQAYRVKSNFLELMGLVSHEMKTPITSLQLQLEMLKRIDAENLTPNQKAMLDRVWKSSERSVVLMNSLLEFAKYQSGRVEPKPEDFDLPTLVTELTDSLIEMAHEKKLELRLIPAPKGLPLLRSDRLLVGLVIKNLVANAIKYTRQGSVHIFISFENGQHRVSVQDTGIGIPLEQQGRIFEPFERIEPLRRKHQAGFGLGLAIAKETAKILGGKIELTSEEGKGSNFMALFPSLSQGANSTKISA